MLKDSDLIRIVKYADNIDIIPEEDKNKPPVTRKIIDGITQGAQAVVGAGSAVVNGIKSLDKAAPVHDIK